MCQPHIESVTALSDICVFITPQNLNGTLAIDSPFQTLTVDLSLNL